jgi:hypothetical protein
MKRLKSAIKRLVLKGFTIFYKFVKFNFLLIFN